MKIFLTGATGFVGAHTARALLEAGHELRLLVRNRQAAEAYFAEYGYVLDDFVVCDMLDREAVKQGMRGCDAVIHAAAVVDLNARNAVQTQRINLQGIDSVIGTACDLGIPRIIYVSSMSALLTPGAGIIDENAALGTAHDAYSKSKQMCEQKVRSLQDRGYPIIISYPSGVFGPDDPRMSQSNDAFLKFFQLMVPMTSAGIQHVDVRDVARAHVLLLQKPLEKDKTRERYLVAGYFTPWREFALQLEQASGIRIRKVPVPGWLFRLIGVLFDAARAVVNISLPVTVESTRIVTQSPQFDSGRLLKTVDMQFRDPLQTYADTVAWLRKKGYLKK